MRPISALLALLAFSGSLLARPMSSPNPSPRAALTSAQTAAIDQFVQSELIRQRIPGLEVGVYSRGRVLLAKGYGLADIELNVPVTAHTLMQSGSAQTAKSPVSASPPTGRMSDAHGAEN
ncbi:MAG TPA: serine hydrolase [Acidobacteriaceae bacterium]|nr:serine hydrolase [Acidobacteriaceae bacterium]